MKINTFERKIALLLMVMGIANAMVYGQREVPSAPKSVVTNKEPKPLHLFYLGIGTSLYGKYGILGLAAGVRVNQKLIGEAHFGFGGWGPKSGVSITTNAGVWNGWCQA